MMNSENPTIGSEIISDGQGAAIAGVPAGEPAAEATPETVTKSGGGFLGSMGSMLAFAVGYFIVKAVPMNVTVMLLAGLAAGFTVGLIPFFVARARRQKGLAGWALGLCSLAGVIMGLLLAGPLALVFTVVALTRTRGVAVEPATDGAAITD